MKCDNKLVHIHNKGFTKVKSSLVNASPTNHTKSTLNTKFSTKNGLRFLHVNCRSFSPKKDEIMWLTQSSNIDILCLTETWLNQNILSAELEFPGYTILRKDRINRTGGGVAIYIKNTLCYKERSDIVTDQHIEMLWTEITTTNKDQNILVSCIYRPPDATIAYFNHFIDTLEKAHCEDKNMIIMGDLNINYEINESLHNNPIFMIEQLLSLSQLIDEPTKVTNKSSSLIDIILTSCPSKHITSGVYKSTLSDHYMVYTEYRIDTERQPHNEIRFRNYNSFNSDKFLDDCQILHNHLQTTYESINDNDYTKAEKLDLLWEKWKSEFARLSNIHAPFKISRLKIRRNKWVTSSIIQAIYKRDYLHKKAIKSNDVNKSNILWTEYRKQRNHVTNIIRNAKLEHYNTVIETHKHKPKQFWKEMKTIIPSSKSDVSKDITADEFNEYFANIGNTVASSLPHLPTYKCKLQDSIHQFKFQNVDPGFVKKIINSLPKDSKNDIFDIDTKLLNISSHIVSPFLSLLFNLSLCAGYCPPDWKLAKVTPAYKDKGDKNDKNNYRPLSVIGHIAMIIEKCVQRQLIHYLYSHKFITIDQFAYLSKHSTQTCLHRLIDDVLENVNEKEITALCFLDIKKCFDTINHEILLVKLQKYGIKNDELNWFKSYLHNRKQQVMSNTKISSKRTLNIGVPQGTVLGPVLFLLFVNDLSNVITNANINIYADDVVVYCSHTCKQTLKQQMQYVMNNVYEWYVENRLTLSLDKCNTMIINDHTNVIHDDFHIYLGTTKLEQINSIKYLGLVIDDKLKWYEHVLNVIKKVNINNAKIRRLGKTIPLEIRRKIHTSFSAPLLIILLQYGDTFTIKILS